MGKLTLSEFFNNPHLLREPGVIDLLTKGFVTQPVQMFDNFVTTEVCSITRTTSFNPCYNCKMAIL